MAQQLGQVRSSDRDEQQGHIHNLKMLTQHCEISSFQQDVTQA